MHRVFKDSRGFKATWVLKEFQEQRVLRATRVLKDSREFQEQMVLRATRVLKDSRDFQELRVIPVHREYQELKDFKARWDQQDHRVSKVLRVALASVLK